MKSRAAILFEAGQKLEICEVDVQDPGPGDADPVQDPQPRVYLPMALALERRPGEVGL